MNSVLEELKEEVAAANNELSKLTEALYELERNRNESARPCDESEECRLQICNEENELESDLDKLRSEELMMEGELAALLAEERELDVELSRLREESITLTRTVIESEESIESVNRKLKYCQSSLRKLKRMSLLKEAFYIVHGEGAFGSINGLRLGRPNVAWSEINAALGFMCLLAEALVKKASVSLSQYRMIPRGSYSVLVKKSDKSVLELYADESAGGISRFLTGRKFDSALTAFVQVTNEIVSNLQKKDTTFRIPFTMEDSEGKVGGLSVGLQFNSEENWTRAMKMLLANLKAVLDHVESTY
jgi:beclin 1